MSRTEPIPQLRFELPPGATEVLLVRHGESAPADPEKPWGHVDGQGDPELAPVGREQAARLADRLEAVGVDAIYVTNLRRTHETAAPLAARLGLTPKVETDLREVHLGEWEHGIFREKAVAGDPTYLSLHTEERWEVIPGAEATEVFSTRVVGALERIVAAHPGQRVMAVTHGGAIGAALAHITRSRTFAFGGANNASISVVVFDGDRHWLRSFNDTAHLGEVLATAGPALPT